MVISLNSSDAEPTGVAGACTLISCVESGNNGVVLDCVTVYDIASTSDTVL